MKVTVLDVAGRAEMLAGKGGAGREITSPRLSTPDLSLPGGWRDIASTLVHLPPSQLRYRSETTARP